VKTRYVLVGMVIVLALGAWGLVTLSGGDASTPVYDREPTRECLLHAGFEVRWHDGSAETGLPGLELGPAAEPVAELRFAPSADAARNATVESEDTVYDNVIVYGEIRDSKLIRGCLREA
jgi:hypothetical protein